MTVSTVLQMRKELQFEPQVINLEDVMIIKFARMADIAGWLEVRERSFADQVPRPRSWGTSDFAAEISQQWWWRTDRCWMAFSKKMASSGRSCAVGSITLARRGSPADSVPAIHWLGVVPEARGQGVGRALLSRLERACWQDGDREIRLETHCGWKQAVEFYWQCGYTVV